MEAVNQLWQIQHVFTTAPALEDMDVGQVALGDGTESAPASGSDAIYYKPDNAKIVCTSTNGSSIAVRFIT